MSEASKTVAPSVAFVAPTKINGAAVSYSAYLRARGFDISPAEAQFFWDNEGTWRTSPERVTERATAKAAKEAAVATREAEKAKAKAASLEAERATILAKAKALGIVT